MKQKKESFISKVKGMKLLSTNQLGFSMMEAMMGMGIMAITALGMMQLQKSSSDMQHRTSTKMELWQVQSNIRQYFYNGDICKETLKDINVLAADAIKQEDPGFDANKDASLALPFPSIKLLIKREGQPDITRTMLTSQRVDLDDDKLLDNSFGGGNLLLNELAIWKVEQKTPFVAGSTSRRFKVDIRVEFLKSNGKGKKSETEEQIRNNYNPHNFFLTIDAMIDNSGKIVDCFNSEGNAVETAVERAVAESKKATCESMNLDRVNGTDNVWNEATQSCESKSNNSQCSYAGSYTKSNIAAYNVLNPVTKSLSCPANYTAKVTGVFSKKVSEKTCNKQKCYDFAESTQYTCVRCANSVNPVSQTSPVNTGQYPTNNTQEPTCKDKVTEEECLRSGLLPIDEDGDECYDVCMTTEDAAEFGESIGYICVVPDCEKMAPGSNLVPLDSDCNGCKNTCAPANVVPSCASDSNNNNNQVDADYKDDIYIQN